VECFPCDALHNAAEMHVGGPSPPEHFSTTFGLAWPVPEGGC